METESIFRQICLVVLVEWIYIIVTGVIMTGINL